MGASDITLGLTPDEARVTALALHSYIQGHRTLMITDPPSPSTRALINKNVVNASEVLSALDAAGARSIDR